MGIENNWQKSPAQETATTTPSKEEQTNNERNIEKAFEDRYYKERCRSMGKIEVARIINIIERPQLSNIYEKLNDNDKMEYIREESRNIQIRLSTGMPGLRHRELDSPETKVFGLLADIGHEHDRKIKTPENAKEVLLKIKEILLSI